MPIRHQNPAPGDQYRHPMSDVSRQDFIAALRATADGRPRQGLAQWYVPWSGKASLPLAAKVLQDAAGLLAGPESWCQFTHGLDEQASRVSPDSPACVQRCLEGAIIRAEHTGGLHGKGVSAATQQMAECTVRWLVDGLVPVYNDAEERTHAEVLDVLWQGVALLQEAATD